MYSHVLQILFFRDKWYQQTPAPCQDINIKLLIQACLCWSRVQRFRNDTRGGEQNYRCWLQCCPQQRSWGVYLFARNSSIITKKKLQDDIELFKLHPFAYLKVISDFAWKHAKQQPFFKPKEAEIKTTDSTLRLFSVVLLFVCCFLLLFFFPILAKILATHLHAVQKEQPFPTYCSERAFHTKYISEFPLRKILHAVQYIIN